MEIGLLRSNARCGPVPLTPVCGWGPGVFLLGRGSWGIGYYGVVAVIAGAGEGIVRAILLLADRVAGIETN